MSLLVHLDMESLPVRTGEDMVPALLHDVSSLSIFVRSLSLLIPHGLLTICFFLC